MDANVIAAREVYDLMVRGEIAQSQVRCREFLVDHPNDFLIDLLYTKSVELSANYPEAIRSYLALIALLKDAKSGTSVYPLNKDDLQISDYLSHYGAQHIRCERPNVTF